MSRVSLVALFGFYAVSTGFSVPAEGEVLADANARTAPFRLDTLHREGRTYLVSSVDGGRAELTLDPQLQQATEEVLRSFQVPYAGAVVLSIADGRVLAMVGRSAVDPKLGVAELALRPWAPAASIFKVVSAAALVAEGGLSSASKACYHGGVSSVLADNLVDLPLLDRRCDTLAYGLGKSQNAIFAKLATQHLTPAKLQRVATAFGFGQPIPFEMPVEPSHLDVPSDDGLEFARTAAGFWHSTLSPLHGALMAAAVASGGEMPVPTLIDRAYRADGAAIQAPAPRSQRVISAAVAREVGRMMEVTTRIGTAKHTFRDRRGNRILPIEVAGKTGTLSAETDKGYVGYSWFIGYAPAGKPTIAFAVALGNHATWKIKASYVARRIVTAYVADKGDRPSPRLLAAR
ncbi:MAG TPA: penicillin-binding transpeptidase domain-containing protein [Polyangia bacterium]|nr:penicillin-binding transpeptidase domain-containing protein [Polyangia bacterium]